MNVEELKAALVGTWVSLAPETRPSKNPDGTIKPFFLQRRFVYHPGDRFELTVESLADPFADAVHKSSSVQALLVSMSLRPVTAAAYRLWVDGKVVPTREIPAFRANVIDLAAQPAMWADRGVHYLHFHLRRSSIDETSADLGYDRVSGFQLAVAEEDLVLAQIARSVLPFLRGAAGPPPIAFDQLELILAAHVAQRFGGARPRRAAVRGGLAAWQRARSLEILRIASQSGFGDQAALTRTFRRLVGVTPGQFRRENGRRG